ncbi:GntR family transcriptional regulator [Halovulum sp. GXIMD14793]
MDPDRDHRRDRLTDMAPTAHEAVYRQLKARVMNGLLSPGQALTLRGIAEEFGVSMTPAREAVRRLTAEGGLKLTSSGRVLVTTLTPERIEELASIRSLLEPELAARALPRAHGALIDRMHDINRQIAVAIREESPHDYVRQNLDFHRILYLRAQAPAMLALAETVWLQMGPTMRTLYTKQRSNAHESHQKILASLMAGDEPGLRLALRADINGGLRMLVGP